MKRRNGHKRSIEERREEAEIRQESRNKLSNLEQIAKLTENGVNVEREIIKLKEKILSKSNKKKKTKKRDKK